MLPLLLFLASQLPPVPLVEVTAAETNASHVSKDMAQVEDAIALGFNTESLHVETRRQRLTRTPPAVYFHQQALQACASPYWPKERVLQCVQRIPFPNPVLRPPRFIRATHVLRVYRKPADEGDLLVMSLQTLGSKADETVVRRTLPKDATPSERRTTALAMAGELLGPLRGR